MSDAETRHLRLYETLRTRICLLDYPPGTKLGEEALAAEFGVSRTPLRRVLSRLADEGLLETRHGVGTLVTDVEPLELAHIYALRMELAELTGRLSPCEITPDMLAKARAFADEADALQAAPDPRAFAELNLAFFTFGLSLTENTPSPRYQSGSICGPPGSGLRGSPRSIWRANARFSRQRCAKRWPPWKREMRRRRGSSAGRMFPCPMDV